MKKIAIPLGLLLLLFSCGEVEKIQGQVEEATKSGGTEILLPPVTPEEKAAYDAIEKQDSEEEKKQKMLDEEEINKKTAELEEQQKALDDASYKEWLKKEKTKEELFMNTPQAKRREQKAIQKNEEWFEQFKK